MDIKIEKELTEMFQNALEAKRIKEYTKAYNIFTDIIAKVDFLFEANLITEKWYKDIFAVATMAKQEILDTIESNNKEMTEALSKAIGSYVLGKTLQSTHKILYNNKVYTLDSGTKVGQTKTDD